jgi:hypothetical protein
MAKETKVSPFKDFHNESARTIMFAFLKSATEVRDSVFAILGKAQERGMQQQKEDPWQESNISYHTEDYTNEKFPFADFVSEVVLELTDAVITGGMQQMKRTLHAWLQTAQIRGRGIQAREGK